MSLTTRQADSESRALLDASADAHGHGGVAAGAGAGAGADSPEVSCPLLQRRGSPQTWQKHQTRTTCMQSAPSSF
jgi:hypothetical protein